MKSATIIVDIMSYWHVGTGYGQGAAYDAVTRKDGDGLPFLPGRTLKGLLREGVTLAEEFGGVVPGTTCALFGTPACEGSTVGSKPGILSFTSASLPDDIVGWVRANTGAAEMLYGPLASTALDQDGQARDRSLRTIEVCAPVKLIAKVTGPDDLGWLKFLQIGGALVRGLGSHRNRGLGRCRITCSTEVGQ